MVAVAVAAAVDGPVAPRSQPGRRSHRRPGPAGHARRCLATGGAAVTRAAASGPLDQRAGCGRGSARCRSHAVRQAVLEAALVLWADHELAPSTLAARVAAAFRADPYAVVEHRVGPASGSWWSGSSGAPSEVERLLAEAERTDAGDRP